MMDKNDTESMESDSVKYRIMGASVETDGMNAIIHSEGPMVDGDNRDMVKDIARSRFQSRE